MRSSDDADDRRGGKKATGSVARNGQSNIVDQRDGDVAAEHGEGAMREIDEIHQPERHRQPDRQHEQQHAVGNAVEQDAEDRGEHGGAVALFFSRSSRDRSMLRPSIRLQPARDA